MLRAIFGTDAEVRLAAQDSRIDAAQAIDEMRQNNQRLREAVRPARNLDEAFRQVTETR